MKVKQSRQHFENTPSLYKPLLGSNAKTLLVKQPCCIQTKFIDYIEQVAQVGNNRSPEEQFAEGIFMN